MRHGHSVICRERQKIVKRALVIHLAANRYLSQHIETFQNYYGTTTSKVIPLSPAADVAVWDEGVIGVRMQMRMT